MENLILLRVELYSIKKKYLLFYIKFLSNNLHKRMTSLVTRWRNSYFDRNIYFIRYMLRCALIDDHFSSQSSAISRLLHQGPSCSLMIGTLLNDRDHGTNACFSSRKTLCMTWSIYDTASVIIRGNTNN